MRFLSPFNNWFIPSDYDYLFHCLKINQSKQVAMYCIVPLCTIICSNHMIRIMLRIIACCELYPAKCEVDNNQFDNISILGPLHLKS